MKRTEVNQNKQKILRTESGGKGRENGGKGRSRKIEIQIVPETCPTCFIMILRFFWVYFSRETLLKAAIQVIQCR